MTRKQRKRARRDRLHAIRAARTVSCLEDGLVGNSFFTVIDDVIRDGRSRKARMRLIMSMSLEVRFVAHTSTGRTSCNSPNLSNATGFSVSNSAPVLQVIHGPPVDVEKQKKLRDYLAKHSKDSFHRPLILEELSNKAELEAVLPDEILMPVVDRHGEVIEMVAVKIEPNFRARETHGLIKGLSA